MRLFLAIHPSDAAVDHLRKVQAALRPIAPEASFTRDVNLHLTLRFFGETPADRLDRLRESIRTTVAGGGALRLAATQLLFFPPSGGARVVAARVGGGSSDQLLLLQSALERATRSLGFPPEEKRFTPHITLARADGRGGGRPLAQPVVTKMFPAVQKYWPGPEFEVRHLTLMESELSSGGSRYRHLSQFDLFG